MSRLNDLFILAIIVQTIVCLTQMAHPVNMETGELYSEPIVGNNVLETNLYVNQGHYRGK